MKKKFTTLIVSVVLALALVVPCFASGYNLSGWNTRAEYEKATLEVKFKWMSFCNVLGKHKIAYIFTIKNKTGEEIAAKAEKTFKKASEKTEAKAGAELLNILAEW